MAIFFSRPLTLTINSLDIDFLSVEEERSASAPVPDAVRGYADPRSSFAHLLMEVAGRICGQLICDTSLQFAAGDAFEIDQTDRDLSRDLKVPSARADGHKLDSNGNSI